MNRTHWIVIGGLAAGLVALAFGGWQVLVHPKSAEYADQMAQKADLEQQLQTARDTAAQFDKFKAQAENMRRDLDFYSSRTDVVLDQNEVTQMVTRLGNQMNLKDWVVTVKPPAAAGGGSADLQACKVEVRFKADFEHLGLFLNNCVSQLRILVPDNVIIKALDDPTGTYADTVDVDLFLTVYGSKSGGSKGKS